MKPHVAETNQSAIKTRIKRCLHTWIPSSGYVPMYEHHVDITYDNYNKTTILIKPTNGADTYLIYMKWMF